MPKPAGGIDLIQTNNHKPRAMLLLVEACLFCLCITTACRSTEKQTDQPAVTHNKNHAGIHNVHEVAPGLISGSAPESDADFAALQTQGVRTILSVDGATPDIAAAHRHGLRYVHLPIGYHGIDPQRQLEIARAIHDLPGPVYVHCHHGKHRGPTAAATAAVILGRLSSKEGVMFLRTAGTSDNYPGLYACVERLEPVDAATLDSVPNDFPEIAPVPGFTKAMADTQAAFDHLVEIRDAGWQTPEQHPDLVPLAEAGRLENLLRVLKDDLRTADQPADFQQMLVDSWQAAQQLEAAIAQSGPHDERTQQLAAIQANCRACHAIYRNTR